MSVHGMNLSEERKKLNYKAIRSYKKAISKIPKALKLSAKRLIGISFIFSH